MKNWTTREGQEIPISNMTDTHLVNSFNMKLRLLKNLMTEQSDFYLDLEEEFDFDDHASIPVIGSPQSTSIETTQKWLATLLNEIAERRLRVRLSL